MDFQILHSYYIILDSRIKDGYVELRIEVNNRTHWQRRYRLVYDTFMGGRIKGMHIHHIDHNTFNDSPENLIMMTREDHAAYHGIHYNTKGVGSARMLGHEHSNETKVKMSEAAIGNNNSNSEVRSLTKQDWCDKIREALKGNQNRHPRTDITKEIILKMKEERQISLRSIARELNCSLTCVLKRLK